MTHRKFQVFELSNFRVFSEDVDTLLNSGKDIKSLSICEIVGGKIILSLGYDDTITVSHKYHLTVANIGSSTEAEYIQDAISYHANAIDGIICQDLTEVDGDLILTFLTFKD